MSGTTAMLMPRLRATRSSHPMPRRPASWSGPAGGASRGRSGKSAATSA